ncbi:hypothetical protein LEP1GSC038_2173 [Leptospira weilii str. 2006001855]|uniref:Uncharacterized protein n=1 Tax=Leptospira weilii str. 2006001855 TaxID=996804 RepID=M6FMM6_9LEPT|nr:hypothetical protein LEP1GSC038_2173 [Leptospira weilii str. 2006001855]
MFDFCFLEMWKMRVTQTKTNPVLIADQVASWVLSCVL